MRRLLMLFLTLVGRVFFRRIEVTGRQGLPDGPVILIGNHPNSLLDPLLIAITVGRPLAFAAKAPLFKQLGIGWVVKTAGGVPIHRRMDNQGGKVDNSSAFAALDAVLERGEAFGIFPEGVSNPGPELAPLKTGAARIALGAADRGVRASVVPVGLTYWKRDRMRGRVLVHYGAPIRVPPPRPPQDGQTEDETLRAQARDLTEVFDDALREVTVNAPDFETARALDVLRAALTEHDTELAERAELSRLVADAWEDRADDPAMKELLDQARGYAQVLEELDMSDEALRSDPSRFDWTLRLARHALLLALWLPLALPGLILHAPVLATAVVMGRKLSPRDDVTATTRMLLVTMGVLMSYVVVTVVVFFGLPLWTNVLASAWALVFLMLSGWAAIRVLERQSALRRTLHATSQLVRWNAFLGFLRGERGLLRERFLELLSEDAPEE
ncbi:MAG: 1-acyl-sn-glycerol-3-phosphate acyltransferase [Deltaproteobacteria bacterium]|nr:1-acyl-sn-glycerol-3-phosphate acyltransferase [Deltaproteobacteria bacterium]